MLGKILTSPKIVSTNLVKTELMTPDNFYQIINDNSNILFLHMNISLIILTI